MLTTREKRRMWRRVCEDFPSDRMMQEVHFIGEVLVALKKRNPAKTYEELAELTREECAEFVKSAPQGAASRT